MSDLESELASLFGDDWEQRLGGTYHAILGEVPPHVRERWAVVGALGRPELIEAIEGLRAVAIATNRLENLIINIPQIIRVLRSPREPKVPLRRV